MCNKLRILFLSAWYPYPPDNGARQRAFHVLQGLVRKHQVTLISFFDTDQSPNDVDPLHSLCEQVIALPRRTYNPNRVSALAGFISPKPRFLVDTFEPAVLERIRQELGQGYDLVLAGELGMAVYAVELDHPAKIFDDVEIGLFAEMHKNAGGVSRLRNRMMWLKHASYMRSILPRFRALTVVSPVERERVLELGAKPENVFVMPNGVDAQAKIPAVAPEPMTLVYNGSMTYVANLDAMRYFVWEILPIILQSEPQARLKITGRTTQVAQNELGEDNAVLFTGYVRDVRAVVRASSVCVVPLRIGGGTRLKILEAMAVGTPVVSSSKGAEGLDLQDDVHLLIADEPQAFADATLRLLCDQELRSRLTQAARERVLAKYDWRIIQGRYDDMIAREFVRV